MSSTPVGMAVQVTQEQIDAAVAEAMKANEERLKEER